MTDKKPPDLEEMKAKVEARIKPPAVAAGNNGNGAELTPDFIKLCLYANEMGDGTLYAAVLADQFIFNESANEWFEWCGHHWRRDILNRAKASVEKVADVYWKESQRLEAEKEKVDKDQVTKIEKIEKLIDKYIKRVYRLRSKRGRQNCLEFAHSILEGSLSLRGDEFDLHDYLFACKNGVIDLRTGELHDGRPDQYLSRASNIEYLGIEEPAPIWEKTLLSIFQDDQELVDYLARLLGYGITGSVKERILPVFWGQGRNGKGTIIDIMSHVLGDMAAPVQAEMLLDQGRARSSGGPSADIMGLKGLRQAYATPASPIRVAAFLRHVLSGYPAATS